MSRRLAFVDTETTGLDPFVHEAYEVAWAIGLDGDVNECVLPHTLEAADPVALKVGGYWDRGFKPNDYRHSFMHNLRYDLVDATLVAANPAFDAAFLRKALGVAPWHHRLVDVEGMAQWAFRLDEVPSFREVHNRLVDLGHDIEAPDHSAAGDVRTLRGCYRALVAIRAEAVPA